MKEQYRQRIIDMLTAAYWSEIEGFLEREYPATRSGAAGARPAYSCRKSAQMAEQTAATASVPEVVQRHTSPRNRFTARKTRYGGCDR